MPDIRTLLHDAAPQPLTALDMAGVRDRAARRPRRRLVTWIAGLGAVVAAGVGVGLPGSGGILVNSGQDDGAAVIESDSSRTDETVEGAETALDPPRSVQDGATSVSPPVSTPSASAPVLAADPAEPTAEPSAEYPPAASCSVDNQGLASGDSRSCRFTATSTGGWNYYQPTNHLPSVSNIPTVSVRVTRDGWTTLYNTRMVQDDGPTRTYHLEGCADDIIEPGDLVEVVITEPYDATVHTEMGGGAGEHWGCTDSGP